MDELLKLIRLLNFVVASMQNLSVINNPDKFLKLWQAVKTLKEIMPQNQAVGEVLKKLFFYGLDSFNIYFVGPTRRKANKDWKKWHYSASVPRRLRPRLLMDYAMIASLLHQDVLGEKIFQEARARVVVMVERLAEATKGINLGVNWEEEREKLSQRWKSQV